MKRLCIVTWIGTGNFGTSLQSYALHRALEKMGYEVTILKYFTLADFTLMGKLHRILSTLKATAKQFISDTAKQRKLRDFNHCYYHISELTTFGQYNRFVNDIDVFIAGSDQIWNCYNGFYPFYFLSFAKDKKRMAYASSIGTDAFPSSCEELVKSLLSRFQHIGVREQVAADVINRLLGIDSVIRVADPTFLLDRCHWQKLAETAKIELSLPKSYILCYFVGANSRYRGQLDDVKLHTGISDVIFIPSLEHDDFVFNDTTIYDAAGPKEFISLIQHAALVCTDSFHATAMSLILGKPFVEFLRFADSDEKSQNSRIYDLLQLYNLQHRIYEHHSPRLYAPIDFVALEEIITTERKRCTDYLFNSIEQ